MRVSLQKLSLHVKDVPQLGQEPLVDVGHLPNLVNQITAIERGRDCKNVFVRRVHELFVDILDKVIL
jgi:hypothetical protein